MGHPAVVSTGAEDDTWAEATALHNRGLELAKAGRYRAAAVAYERAADVSRAAGHTAALAVALDNLSVTTAWCGRIEQGLAAHSEAIAAYRSLDDAAGESRALSNLAAIRFRAGDPQSALEAQRRAVEVARAAGDRGAEARAHAHHGQLLAGHGDQAGAVQAHQAAVDLWRDLGDPEAEAQELKMLALRLVETDRKDEALQAAARAVRLLTEAGRQEEAEALAKWAASPRVPGGYQESCVAFLFAVGALCTLLADGPRWVWATLTALAVVSVWGTCLGSLTTLALGTAVVWTSWGTWWVYGGAAVLVFAGASLTRGVRRVRASTTATRRNWQALRPPGLG